MQGGTCGGDSNTSYSRYLSNRYYIFQKRCKNISISSTITKIDGNTMKNVIADISSAASHDRSESIKHTRCLYLQEGFLGAGPVLLNSLNRTIFFFVHSHSILCFLWHELVVSRVIE